MLPFTSEVFLSQFAHYNAAIWPVQIVACALGLLAVAAVVRPFSGSDRIAGGVLVAFWGWTGVAYHWFTFAAINSPRRRLPCCS